MRIDFAQAPVQAALIALFGIVLTALCTILVKWVELRLLGGSTPKPTAAPRPTGAGLFWNDRVKKYGWLHRVHPKESGRRTRTLLVFIHGILGNPRKYWGDFPKRILMDAEEEFDVFSFTYNSGFWLKGNVRDAASDLQNALCNHLPSYHEYIFITHSAGGLVFKTYLLNLTHEDGELRPVPTPSTFKYRQLDLASGRLRAVVFAGVPHFGGEETLWKFMNRAYESFHAVTKPLKWIINFATQGKVPCGFNEFPSLLRPHNAELATLHADFLQTLGTLREREHNVVTVINISGRHDGAVLPIPQAESVVIERATHPDLLESLGTHVPALLRQNPPTESLIARATVERSLDLDAFSRVTELFPNAQGTTYRALFDRVTDPQAAFPEMTTLSGPAGTGKSVILRRLARDLVLRYWESTTSNRTFLPLIMPLQQVNLNAAEISLFVESGTAAWHILAAKWLEWGQRLANRYGIDPSSIYSSEWLELTLGEQNTVLVIDSVDEFLVNHPDISTRAILNCLLYLLKKNRGNPRLSILIGIRDEHSASHSIRKQSAEARQLDSPELPELCTLFSIPIQLVQDTVPPKLLEIVMRPVLFRHLAGAILKQTIGGRPVTEYLRTEGMVCELALRELLRSRPIPEGENAEDLLSEDAQLDLLAMIAWCYYGHSPGGSGSLDRDEVLGIAKSKLKVWQAHHTQHNSEASKSGIEALGRASNPPQCDRYLNSSVFFPVDATSYRFIHNLWQDFLIGRYLSLCINAEFYEELGEVAYKQNIMKLGAHFVGPMRITDTSVGQVVETRMRTGRELVFANYCAFVAVNPAAVIEPSGLSALLDHLQQLSPPLRLVDCVAMIYRIAYFEPPDSLLRTVLIDFLKQTTRPGATPDRIFNSLCFCYRVMLAPDTLQDASSGWALPLFPHKDEVIPQLKGLCHFEEGRAAISAPERTVQAAFVQVTKLLWEVPVEGRAIAAIHYCYYLVLCSVVGGATFDTRTELTAWFRADRPGALLPLLLAHTGRVEVILLHEHCQQLLSGTTVLTRIANASGQSLSHPSPEIGNDRSPQGRN